MHIRSRIGEFTPLGFLVGFILCFSFFWTVYHRLPFGTQPPVPPAKTTSGCECEQLSVQLRRDEDRIAGLEHRVDTLELELQRGARSKPKSAGPVDSK